MAYGYTGRHTLYNCILHVQLGRLCVYVCLCCVDYPVMEFIVKSIKDHEMTSHAIKITSHSKCTVVVMAVYRVAYRSQIRIIYSFSILILFANFPIRNIKCFLFVECLRHFCMERVYASLRAHKRNVLI